ncbi:membrane protein insertion efficiency factor YidD [Ornithinimicrobium kibberense]|uniref:Putative membrane protein insertion efficiency factor n=2 Tax=Ornithinimicrobium kibberense TaxID=282060 RepID=A0ABV5V1H1_9MICO|nr:membrane protein insertion efficiency factor YidD [Ornithinimicrobium kibberense]
MTEGSMRDVHRGGVPAGESRSLLARPLVWLVQLYQRTVSPLLGPVCRYYPSCSAYSVTALERFGPLRGTWLTVTRLLRCNPWARGGVDHVPAREGAGTPHTHSGPDHEDRHRTTPPVGQPHRRD